LKHFPEHAKILRRNKEYLEGYVPSKPNSGEVAPPQLSLYNISPGLEAVSDSNSMVSTTLVIFCPFVFRFGVI
jgi:hypothetical protein